MLTLKPSDFRPAYKNEVSFDLAHKNQVSRSPHWKQIIFDPHKKKQVSRDPPTKTKSILIHTWKPDDYRPEHNKINFDPRVQNGQFRTHTKKIQ